MRVGPLYSCVDGAPGNTSSQSGLHHEKGDTAKEVAERPNVARITVIFVVVAVVCFVLVIAALFLVWYLRRRRNQRRKR